MKVREYVRRSEMPVPAAELFGWHTRPGAFRRLLPAWEKVRVIRAAERIENGDRAVLSVPIGPFRVRWVAEHDEYKEGESFRDLQAAGPFALWEHTHRAEPLTEATSILEDRIRYALPLGRAGDVLGERAVRRRLERTFDFRHERTRFDLLAHERFKDRRLQRVLVSGASGLVGSELTSFLTSGGHEVVELSRRPAGDRGIRWSPEQGQIEADKLTGFNAVVHLAGEPVAGRWTAQKKRRIRDSRIKGTRLLAETLAGLPEQDRPRTFVCASATGFYGDRGDEVLTEDSSPGGGFLADVCREWEAACEPARQAGIRVVNVRIGLVLAPRGGVLGTLLPLFRAGLGGRLGGGRQWMSWIAIDDLTDVLHAAMMDESFSGPVNATVPHPVTNADFTNTLGRVLHRPTVLPVPAFAVRTALGEAADELALASARVLPQRLQDRGHAFRYPELARALRFLLGR